MHYSKDLYHATQMYGSHYGATLPYSIQPVVALVKMEGHSMNQPAHVTVQTTTVGIPVEVSTLQAMSHHATRMNQIYIHMASIKYYRQ